MIYSRVIFKHHSIPTGTVVEFPLPESAVYVVRDMDAFIPGIGGGAIQVYDADDITFWSDSQASGTNGVWFQWRGRQVIQGPSSVFVTGVALGVIDPSDGPDIRASGYILTTP